MHSGTLKYPDFIWFKDNKYSGGFVLDVATLRRTMVSRLGNIGGSMSSEVNTNQTDHSAYGASAWNKFAPGKPSVDLGVALAELRELPMMLRETAKGFHNVWKSLGGDFRSWTPKMIASQFLNEQFGWVPFLSDCKRTFRTISHLSEGLIRVRRQNGRWIHRKGMLGTSSDTMTVLDRSDYSGMSPTLLYQGLGSSSPGSCQIEETTSVLRWFSGSFKYYVPDIDTDAFRRRWTIHQLGLFPTPSMLWELTPWSWLIDWGTNLGDIIGNISNQSLGWADNLVARNAYLMGTRRSDYVMTCHQNTNAGGFTYKAQATATWKSRSIASPFGFGLTASDLSARQLAILASLGITRG